MDNDESHVGVRYERKDIRIRGFLVLLVLACCFMAILSYGVWRFFWWEASVQEARKESPYPMAPNLSKQLPPEPRLEQVDRLAGVESVNVDRQLAAQEKVLNSYGPTAEKGFVHIPIQDAIKIVAAKLPVRKETPGPAAADKGLLEAGESNSGRMSRGPSP